VNDASVSLLVNSFAGDDWRYCREHVLRLLGHTDLALEAFSLADTDRTSNQPDSMPERQTKGRLDKANLGWGESNQASFDPAQSGRVSLT
jgi:hypothetical protein